MYEFDDLINHAVGDFRAAEAAAPGLTPGAAAVRATVKHRRAVRLATFSVLGALLIAVPIVAFAADPRGNNPPPTPGESPTPGPVESASPAPDGVITLEQLSSTVVDLPAFSDTCPTTRVKLATADPGSVQRVWVVRIVHTNLDDDPALETAALLLCRVGEAPQSQVVAFDRDVSGKIRTLGQVISNGYKLNIRDIGVRAGGGITADVSDIWACCDTPISWEQHQQREYGWDGTKFTQLGGPTVFGDPARVTDLEVIVADATLGPAIDGKRSAAVTVIVKNNGPNPSGRFQVGFRNCAICNHETPFWAWGSYGTWQAPLAAGEQASTTVNFSFGANTPGGDIEAWLIVVGVDDDREISDFNITNNTAVFHIRLS